MVRLVVVLGSNTDSRCRMRQAREALGEVAIIVAASDEVEAPSYLAGDPRRYSNQALMLEWERPLEEFTPVAHRIEHGLGRRRGGAAGNAGADVEIDIDLVAALDADRGLLHLEKQKLEPRLLRMLVFQVAPDRARAALETALD